LMIARYKVDDHAERAPKRSSKNFSSDEAVAHVA